MIDALPVLAGLVWPPMTGRRLLGLAAVHLVELYSPNLSARAPLRSIEQGPINVSLFHLLCQAEP